MNKSAPQLAKSALRISATFKGEEQARTLYKPSIIVGRANGTGKPDFDLSGDNTVSRSHARIWVEDGTCWLEDLGSKFGTRVDGDDVRGRGKIRVDETSRVLVGDTMLKVEASLNNNSGFAELLPQPALASTIEIDEATNRSAGRLILPKSASLDAVQTQELLLEILVQFSLPSPLDQLLQTIIGRVVDLIPDARRGTLLLRNPVTDGLLLAAFISPAEPAVSETLARRALNQQQAFIWRNNFASDQAMSIHRHQIQSGMYAPLIYDGCSLGVLCVDNPERSSVFSATDLQLLVTVADHAAVAVSHHQLRDRLKGESKLLEQLLTKFPSQVRRRLLEKARLDKPRPGVEKSGVTVLLAEMEGFKARTAPMNPAGQLEILNDYFAALTDPISRFGGTLQNFTGDGVLAFFGSPEPDPAQHQNAIQAALSMQQAIQEVNLRRMAAGQLTFLLSAAIHSGEVMQGYIGSDARCEFAIFGDVVSEGIECAGAARGGEILLSDHIYQKISETVNAEKTVRQTQSQGELIVYRL